VPEDRETSDRPDERAQRATRSGHNVPQWLYPGHVGQHMRRRLPKAVNHKTNGLREIGLALVTAGLVVLLFVAYELVGTNLSEEHSQARLARDFNAAVASVPLSTTPSTTTATTLAPVPSGLVPKGIAKRLGWEPTSPRPRPTAHDPRSPTEELPVTPPGGALEHLVIPVIGVDRYVVQGVAEADLQMGPGHYPGTPLPGQAGNVAIAGHRTTFGAPFFRLNEVHSGDLVYLTDTLGTTWVYRVVSQFVVAPSDVAVLDPTPTPELTLTTCNPRFEATSRLVVRAVLLTHLARGTRVPKPLPVEATKDGRFPRVIGRSRSLSRTSHTSDVTSHSHVTSHLHATSHATTTAPGSGPPPAPATTRPTSSTLPTSGTSSAKTTSVGASPTAGGGGDSPTVGPSPGAASLSGSRTGSGSGTGGAAAGALGWGAIALAAWVITRIVAARRRRYNKVAVLFAGALVCLVPLWFAFGSVVDLLPANI
jgi:sortase A